VLAGALLLLFTGWQILRQFPVEAPLVALFAEQGRDEVSKRGLVIWA
jgi:threonine/homoserine/homoserine lactone efflux protein